MSDLSVEILEAVAEAGYRLVRVPPVAPRLIERDRDLGWLAVSPDSYRFRIGTVGATAEEAETAWFEAYEKWEELGRQIDQQPKPYERPPSPNPLSSACECGAGIGEPCRHRGSHRRIPLAGFHKERTPR